VPRQPRRLFLRQCTRDVDAGVDQAASTVVKLTAEAITVLAAVTVTLQVGISIRCG
jgi:hypothetical protein